MFSVALVAPRLWWHNIYSLRNLCHMTIKLHWSLTKSANSFLIISCYENDKYLNFYTKSSVHSFVTTSDLMMERGDMLL